MGIRVHWVNLTIIVSKCKAVIDEFVFVLPGILIPAGNPCKGNPQIYGQFHPGSLAVTGCRSTGSA
jgi:hypothetical protein